MNYPLAVACNQHASLFKSTAIAMSELVLEINNLWVRFPLRKGIFSSDASANYISAVNGVSLSMQRGDILGLVGESGSGKTTLGRSIIGLTPVHAGTIALNGVALKNLTHQQMRNMRRVVQMIFQDAFSSLNPRMTLYETLAEPLLFYKLVPNHEVKDRIFSLMEETGLDADLSRKYPHQLSGGQCQRAAIARALATNPELIIADEPVSSLDVSVQGQILNLLSNLNQSRQLTLLLISHDLYVVRHISKHIAVMKQGELVETGDTAKVFASPCHEYTKSLLYSLPKQLHHLRGIH